MTGSSNRIGVLSGGNWIIDHVKTIDRFPEQDTLASILDQFRGTGGAPYNVLLDLAKLGASFPLAGIGLVGEDEDGRTILSDCAAHGIDASQVHTFPGAGTSYTDVMTVQSTGRRTFFHRRGANSLLDEQHFDLEISSARILHLGYLLLLDALDEVAEDGSTGMARILEKAREMGFKTSVDAVSEDTARFQAVVTPALPHVDYLIVNEFEASKSTGIEVTGVNGVDFDRASAAARRLFERGVKEWVIIHCPEGALARNRNGEESRQGSVQVPAEQIRGTAGAGDAFAAGALLGLHEGWHIQDSLRLAVCAGASNLFHPTCTGSVQTAERCLALGEELGFRTLRPAG